MIISVTGAASNIGKTTLIQNLLKRLTAQNDGIGWGVCKVTICRPEENHRCPKGKEETCGVCSEDLKSYFLETDETVLRQEGKDTRRYFDFGANSVIWVRTRLESLQEGVEAALDRFSGLSGTQGVIFEGNHALGVLKPDLAVMAVGPSVRYKASAKKIVDKIDLFGEASDPSFLDEVMEQIQGVLHHEG